MDTRSTRHDEAVSAAIEDRFAWAERQGHPAYLWPEVPIAEWRVCLRAIETATAAILRSEPAVRLDHAGSAAAMGVAAFTSGMGPLLGYWLERGVLQTDQETASILRAHREHSKRRAQRMQAELARLLGLLDPVGPIVLIKSAHTMHSYFPEPAARPCADLDFVVAATETERAEALLRQNGYTRKSVTAKPYRSDWVPPDAPTALASIELNHGDNPYTVELHNSLERSFPGVRKIRISGTVGAVARTAADIAPGAHVLRQPELALYLALHTADELHRLQLLWIVELVLVLRRDFTSGADWDALLALAAEAQAQRFVYAPLKLAERLSPGTVPEHVLTTFRVYAPARVIDFASSRAITEFHRVEKATLSDRFVWTSGIVERARRFIDLLKPAGARPISRMLFRLLRGRISW